MESSANRNVSANGSLDFEFSVAAFSGHLGKFQFDKAREFAEEQRLLPCAGLEQKHWTVAMTALGQLASIESHYFSFTFLSTKFSFRKDNHVREAYLQIKSDLEKVQDECLSKTDAPGVYPSLLSLYHQLTCLVTIRTKLVEFYGFLAAESHALLSEDALKNIKMISSSLPKLLSEEIKLPQLKTVQLELQILNQIFEIQQNLLKQPFLHSLLQFKALSRSLNLCFSHVPFKSNNYRPNFFSIFTKSNKQTSKLTLLSWLSICYNTLLAKLTLYSYDLYVSQLPNSEVKVLFNSQPSFVQQIAAFYRRCNPQFVCLTLNRIDAKEEFYGMGYQNTLDRYGPDLPTTISGRNGIYPILFSIPNDKQIVDKYYPSIISIVQDLTDYAITDDKLKYLYDNAASTTYFTIHIERNVYITVIFNRKVSEKDQNIQNMFSELINGVRLLNVHHSLRQSHKT